ncbi:MAG: ABC transporter ATP-binding protein [Proteobacteria bacterium]|jgi:spermidine/putrescine transport system ATP-binding protein|nr:ABC transporter ATP-binding protein [Pseudomonadota bacterium]MDA1301089.1 ABC transporter ATP-binding protein [Pseudomonadota bacterium]
MSNQPIIQVRDVAKYYGDEPALAGVSLDIMAGEFFSLLGPSGCGKTTLLRMISGFDVPDRGSISIDGVDMAGVPPNRRPTNMVFQSYAIFPHLSVAQNVAYGLKRLRLGRVETKRRVEEALALVALEGYGGRQPHELSGGQRQRVALARALVMQPKVLLLDEPMSALDKKLREQMQTELRRLQRAVGITFVLVTHDQEEALLMSDRIAVMFNGSIAQLDSPEGMYRRPVSRQVASFIGMMNFLRADIASIDPSGATVNIEALGSALLPGVSVGKPGSATIGIRPEMLTMLYGDHATAERVFRGKIVDTEYYGDLTLYQVRIDDTATVVTVSMRNTAGRPILQAGDRTRIGWGAESLVLLDPLESAK